MTDEAMETNECAFCEIVSGRLAHHLVDEDAAWIAILDIAPAAPGHTLVLPREHHRRVWDLPPSLAADLGQAVARVGRRLQERLAPAGLTVFQANGEAGWQSVDHVHFHLVPRDEDDGLREPWVEALEDAKQLSAMHATLTSPSGSSDAVPT